MRTVAHIDRELSWEDLIDEVEKIKEAGPLEAHWHAYRDSEAYGIWLIRPDSPEHQERRVNFSLFAARAINKLGIPPVPIPQPLQHCPHWNRYLELEEEFARRQGKSLDLSDAVPYGLATVDLDAVDVCTRAWLEALRQGSRAFRISSNGIDTIKGTKYPTINGEIQDLCGASATYCKQCARGEIEKRLSEPLKVAALAAGGDRPRRIPDLKTSQERIDLVNRLARELAFIKQELRRHCTAEGLKKAHPDFLLWENLTPGEVRELAEGEAFTPKAYAENLVLRKFGLTSRETLKKDRKKLRGAREPGC